MPRASRAGTAYRRVQGLARGLAVLRTLNQAENGLASVRTISEATTLHRTTVRRLLETLVAEGYAERSHFTDDYRLRLDVHDLSEGFRDDQWVASVAAPAMGRLLREVRWPSDLTTPDGSCMRIRESTHRFSSLSFDRVMIGRRLPLLFTASGRAYLAACDATQRNILIKLMIADGGDQAAFANDARLVNNTIARVRHNGYATSGGEWRKAAPAGAIALPIHAGGRIMGCLNVVYLRRALTVADAVKDLLPPLREAVREIEDALDELAPTR